LLAVGRLAANRFLLQCILQAVVVQPNLQLLVAKAKEGGISGH
jgi:hypothetical protein